MQDLGTREPPFLVQVARTNKYRRARRRDAWCAVPTYDASTRIGHGEAFCDEFCVHFVVSPPHAGFRNSRASISRSSSTTNNTEELGVGMHVVRYQPTTQAQELATERRFVTNFAYISWFHPLMQDLGTREPPFLAHVAQLTIHKS